MKICCNMARTLSDVVFPLFVLLHSVYISCAQVANRPGGLKVVDANVGDFDFEYSSLPGSAHELQFELYPGRQECFYQEMKFGADLHIQFEVCLFCLFENVVNINLPVQYGLCLGSLINDCYHHHYQMHHRHSRQCPRFGPSYHDYLNNSCPFFSCFFFFLLSSCLSPVPWAFFPALFLFFLWVIAFLVVQSTVWPTQHIWGCIHQATKLRWFYHFI